MAGVPMASKADRRLSSWIAKIQKAPVVLANILIAPFSRVTIFTLFLNPHMTENNKRNFSTV